MIKGTKSRLKRYILIITAFLLLTQIIRIYNFWVKLVNEEEFVFNVVVSDSNENCEFKLNSWSFSLQNCDEYQSGSEVKLIGRLSTETDSQFFKRKKIDVRIISVNKNLISSVLGWIESFASWIRVMRGGVVNMLMGYMPSTPLALIIDMPFGQIIDLPDQVHQQLKTIGMLHVVAASGYNVSLIAGLLGLLTARFDRPQSMLIWFVGLFGYLFLSDLSISILRAFLMFILKILSNSCGRVYHNFGLLATAVFVFLIFEPWLILNLSFQLSVGATLGLILFADLLNDFFSNLTRRAFLGHKFFTSYLVEPLATAIAAQTITIPILLWHFGEVTAFSFVANLILLWMTPFLTIGGLILFSLGALVAMVPLLEKVLSIYSIYIWFYADLFIKISGYLSQTFLFQIKIHSSVFVFFTLIFLILILILYKKSQYEKKSIFSISKFVAV